MADKDRKPDIAGSERFPKDRGDIKNIGGDPMGNVNPDNDNGGDNEGEGNRSADRRYREGVKKTIQSGKVDEKAKEAEKALEGSEGQELRRAEEQGKKHSHGEDPALYKTKH